MDTTTVEVRPAVRRIVADHPGRAARTIRNAERAADNPVLSDVERERNRALATEFRAALAAAQRCSRCGKEMTLPESIERGVGAECWTKRGAR